jgi:hypothetical protein
MTTPELHESEAAQELAWEAAKEANWRRDDLSIDKEPTQELLIEEEIDSDWMETISVLKGMAKNYCSPDYEGMEEYLIENSYTFKRVSGGFEIYTRYSSKGVGKEFRKRGFGIMSVDPFTEGPFGAKVIAKKRTLVESRMEATERTHRVGNNGN